MNPPLRTPEHCEALWGGVEDGTVDCVASDHAPHTIEEKKCDDPPAGIPGVETMLPLLCTKLPPERVVELCFDNPNRIFRLKKKREEGQISIDLDEEWEIHGKDLHGKSKWTPFEGWKVRGKIVEVACRP